MILIAGIMPAFLYLMHPSRMLLWGLQQTWAIEPDFLRRLFAIANREEGDIDAAAAIRAHRAANLDAVLTADGRRMDGTSDVRVRDNVALIPITGPIFRYADFFSAMSGGATIETLAKDFRTALDSPNVRAIVLHIDSPGGEITGVAQFAAQVYAARLGTKPVVAYIEGLGASAAYWIASAAGEIVLDTTALVGSIGVVQAMPDPAARPARTIEIVSSQSPHKRIDITTEGGRATVQATVDELADLFIADVALYRGATAEQVISDFGGGGVLIGKSAVAAGMADSVESLEATITRLSRGESAPLRGTSTRHAHTETDTMAKGFWGDFWKSAKEAGALEGEADSAPVAVAPTHTDETADLRAKIKAYEAEKATAEAAARTRAASDWAEAQIKAERYAPAMRSNLEAMYSAAVQSDTLPMLTALTEAIPAKATTGEKVATTPLPLDRGTPDTTEDAAARQVAAYNRSTGARVR